MSFGDIVIPVPANEPVKNYAPDSPERAALEKELERQLAEPVEVPLVIGGKEVRTGRTKPIPCPHDHKAVLGTYHLGGREEAEAAVKAAMAVRKDWMNTPWEHRAAIFLRAADLLATRYRYIANAATMLGQSKTAIQAEIDSACELIDFLRFNPAYARKIYGEQGTNNAPYSWSRMEYRPLEGFVFAVTPFNFTAIAGNLPSSPAMMGNVVVWKPASTAVLSAHYVMEVFKEAGLPDGVINLVYGSGGSVADPIIDSPDFAALHFTGSTGVFNAIWKRVGENLTKNVYRTYPRLVGETGGKDFVFAFADADIPALNTALFRGSFEYQGQKCSAASRAYIPASIWPEVKAGLAEMASTARVGDVRDFRNFMGAVIDRSSYDNIVGYIEAARGAADAKIVIGGEYDDRKGYFIKPTVIETGNPHYRSMEEEIFGPVLTVYVYDDDKVDETLTLLDETSPYALTGAVFSRDRANIEKASSRLIHAAGNFYINDKPTGAVVGQQPFGGARMSGTNDKAGSFLNLLRWTSPRTVKENFLPPTDYTYPHMKG